MADSGQSWKAQPNSRHCFVCGLASAFGLKMRFTDNGVDTVRAVYTVPDRYQGYPGVVHGGIVAAMLDETGGRTVMINNPNRFFMTARLDIRYRKPVPTGTDLTLVGRIVHERGRVIQAHSEVHLPDGSTAAEADLTLIEMPTGYLPEDDLAALGWRVYSSQEYDALVHETKHRPDEGEMKDNLTDR